MTICAAVLCKRGEQDVLLCISDRQITYATAEGAIKSEPKHQTKIRGFNPANAVCLLGGGLVQGSTVFKQTHDRIIRDSEKDDRIPDIAAIAGFYAKNFRALRKRRKEERLGVQTIICGLDSGGAQVYCVEDPGTETWQNDIGYCAIGEGAPLFQAQFRLADYDRFWQLPNALLLAYEAKKRARSVESVGKMTDMFLIDSSGSRLISDVAHAVKERYEEFEKAIEEKKAEAILMIANDDRIKPIL
jgi:hypothetical protein